jgi:hypothetical protein
MPMGGREARAVQIACARGSCGFDLDAESEEGERVEVVCSPGTRTKGDEWNPAGGGGARRTAAGCGVARVAASSGQLAKGSGRVGAA